MADEHSLSYSLQQYQLMRKLENHFKDEICVESIDEQGKIVFSSKASVGEAVRAVFNYMPKPN